MNRYDIVDNASGKITHSYEAESPMPFQEGWGVDAYDEQIRDANGNITVIHHDATFSVVVTDLTTILKQQLIDTWVAARSKKCDDDVYNILQPMDDVTHLMLSLYDMYIALNIGGDATATDIADAKARLQSALLLMGQIQQLRAVRDQEIADYLAVQGV
jgi:hypothetical protein